MQDDRRAVRGPATTASRWRHLQRRPESSRSPRAHDIGGAASTTASRGLSQRRPGALRGTRAGAAADPRGRARGLRHLAEEAADLTARSHWAGRPVLWRTPYRPALSWDAGATGTVDARDANGRDADISAWRAGRARVPDATMPFSSVNQWSPCQRKDIDAAYVRWPSAGFSVPGDASRRGRRGLRGSGQRYPAGLCAPEPRESPDV